MTRAALLVATFTLAFVAEAPQARADFVEGFILCVNCGGDPSVLEGTVKIDDGGDSLDGLFTVAIDITSVAGKLLDVYFEDTQWAGLNVTSVSSNYVQPGTPVEPSSAVDITPFGGSWNGVAPDGSSDPLSFTASPSNSPPAITGSGGSFDQVLIFSFSGFTGDIIAFAESVLTDFQQGFRIAMRFGACTESGESCTTIAAPIPGAIWLFISALLGLVGIGYRKREKPAAA